mgnify:CR=1 FL=1
MFGTHKADMPSSWTEVTSQLVRECEKAKRHANEQGMVGLTVEGAEAIATMVKTMASILDESRGGVERALGVLERQRLRDTSYAAVGFLIGVLVAVGAGWSV